MKLGNRQVEVLRAAQAGELVRYDDGGWVARSTGCTRAAQSVAGRGLLADGKRMATYTWGRDGARFGHYVHLSPAGIDVLREWAQANQEALAAEARFAEVVRQIATSGRDITDGDLLRLAAVDERVDDDLFVTFRQVLEGRAVGGES